MSQQEISRTGAALCLALAQGAFAQSPAPSITIGDYSAAQRAVIDAEIRRAVAKAQSAMTELTVPAPSTATPIPIAGSASAPKPVAVLAPPEPRLLVSGVAQLKGAWLAEVVTDDGARLLRVGDAVPGTPWRVESVDAARVTLAKAGPKAKASTRTFNLAGAR
jgi:hypothetical protein